MVYRNWTIDTIYEEAIKYTKLCEFVRNSPGAARAAKRLGVFDDCCKHMVKIRRWSDNELFEEALKYNTRNGFHKGSKSAYTIAVSRGTIKSFWGILLV